MNDTFTAPLPTKLTKPIIVSTPIQQPTLTYQEPEWAAPPTETFGFEIIKQGTVIGKSASITESKLVVGKLSVCDLTLDHGSISRFHAVVQFKSNLVYIYDLASAHGTFINKVRIEPRKYVRLQVGDMVRFGESTRMYVLQGPIADVLAREELFLSQDQIRQTSQKEELEVSWGFKEDAYEGDEWSGIDVASDVERSTIPEDAYYREDPKKALAVFLDNNGVESTVTYSSKGKESIATLVIVGLKGPLSATGRGKKKGAAEIDAALEACYKLEKLDILRLQGGSLAARTKRLRAEVEEEELDNYLDRTNKKVRAVESSVETFASLTKKREAKVLDIEELQSNLLTAGKAAILEEEDDELEAYMNHINDKVELDIHKKLGILLAEAEKDLEDIEKLLRIAAPKGFTGFNKDINFFLAASAVKAPNTKSVEAPISPQNFTPLPKSPLKSTAISPSKSEEFETIETIEFEPAGKSMSKVILIKEKRPQQGPSLQNFKGEDDYVDFIAPTEDATREEILKISSSYGY